MASPELIDYVRSQTQEGVGAVEIRESLMEAGWSEADVENALHDVAAGLHPVTAGASIHEDLAQVRGMVAHLASRVRILESRLAAVSTGVPGPALPAGQELRPERELEAPTEAGWGTKVWTTLLIVVLLAAALSRYQAELGGRAPTSMLWAGAAISAVLFAGAYLFLRRRRFWGATLSAASAAVLGVMVTLYAWLGWGLLEDSIAWALLAVLVVLALVMGAWVDRYRKI